MLPSLLHNASGASTSLRTIAYRAVERPILPRRIRSRNVAGRRQQRRMQGPGYAEVAVVVAHNEHLRGVGTASLRRLGEIARENGVHHLIAEVLADNHPMLRVMTDAGWPCTRHLDGSVLHVEVDLDAIHTVR